MLKRNEKIKLWKIAAFGFIAVSLGIYCQQYFAYQTERKLLDQGIHTVKTRLSSALNVKRNSEKFDQNLRDTAQRLSKMRELAPPELSTDNFLQDFSNLARGMNIEIKEIRSATSSHGFWDQAELTMKLVGANEEIESLLKSVLNGKRLVGYKFLERQKNVTEIVLTIFSILEPKEGKRLKDVTICRESETDVWIWPLGGRIRELNRKLDGLCSEQRQQEKTIKKVDEFKRIMRLVQYKSEVVKELQRRIRTSP